eukprot:TRINITY_DN42166_c0_g1_i1.p1 TRINITY_DN42166_c0_g1~~TRINITY_DN42166_c0_g1_i1.p1  ORF type:complete len:939 (-),score=211.99 TRINITY_DN42166_c0_g1_i1:21-2663(-)
MSDDEIEDMMWKQKAALKQVRADYEARLQRSESFKRTLEDLQEAPHEMQIATLAARQEISVRRRNLDEAMMRGEDELARMHKLLASRHMGHQIAKQLAEEAAAELAQLRRSKGHVSSKVAEEVLTEQKKRIAALRADTQAQDDRLLRLGADLKSVLDFMVRVNIDAAGGPNQRLSREALLSEKVKSEIKLSDIGKAYLEELLSKYEVGLAERRGEKPPSASVAKGSNATGTPAAGATPSLSASTAALLQRRPPPELPKHELPTSSFAEERQLLRSRLAEEMQQVASVLVNEASRDGQKEPAHEELLRAAAWGEVATVQELLQLARDSSTNAAGSALLCKWTAWHSAAAHGQASVLEFLTGIPMPVEASSSSSGIDSEALGRRTAGGFPPLAVACLRGHAGTVRCLLRARACLDDRDDRGNTALHWAAATGSDKTAREMALVLLEAGADPFTCNSCGQTPDLAGLQELALNSAVGSFKSSEPSSTTESARPVAMQGASSSAAGEEPSGSAAQEAYHCIRAEQENSSNGTSSGFLSSTFGMSSKSVQPRDNAGIMRRANARNCIAMSQDEQDGGVWSDRVTNYTHAGLKNAISFEASWCSPTNEQLNKQVLVITSERLLLLLQTNNGSGADSMSDWSVAYSTALTALSSVVVLGRSDGLLVIRAKGSTDLLLHLAAGPRERFLKEVPAAVAACTPLVTRSSQGNNPSQLAVRSSSSVEQLLDCSSGDEKPIAAVAFVEPEVFLLLPWAPSSLLHSIGSELMLFGFLDLQKRSQPKAAGSGVCWRWQRYFFLLKGGPHGERRLGWCHYPNSETWVNSVAVSRITQIRQVVPQSGDLCLDIQCQPSVQRDAASEATAPAALMLRALSAPSRDNWFAEIKTMLTG